MSAVQTAVIIFSKDRAMQLDASLRSFFRHGQDAAQAHIHVLYKTTTPEHCSSYGTLIAEYPAVSFVRETDFKGQVLTMLRSADFVLFVVDDSLFVRAFSIRAITDTLRANSDALGFSLRLGPNTAFNYMAGKPQQLPAFQPAGGSMLRYEWTQGRGNFAYPLEVSSSIYRTADLLQHLPGARFYSPNTLEYVLAIRARLFGPAKPWLLCHAPSIAFCCPVNKVQTNFRGNRDSQTYHYSPDDLNRMFQAGQRIDVAMYDGWVSNACHEEVPYHFHSP